MTKANWNYPTAIKFGPGRIAELPEALKPRRIEIGRAGVIETRALDAAHV